MIIPARTQYRSLLICLLAVFLVTSLSGPGTGSSARAAGLSPKVTTEKNSAKAVRSKANVYFKKGEEYQSQGSYEEAARHYEKAVSIDTGYAEAYSNLGYSYRKQGQFDKALDHYKKALELQPDLAEAHEYIGEAYAEKGEFNMAEKHLAVLKRMRSEEADELEEFIARQKAK